MRYIFVFFALFFSIPCLHAQDIADLPPKITYHRFPNTIYEGFDNLNSHYMIGDSVVTDQELGYYLRFNHPQASRAFNKGLKMERASWYAFGLALGGAALGLLTKPRHLDQIGYGGFIIGGAAGLGLTAWSNRKKGTGVYLYNLDRQRRIEKLNELSQPPRVKQKGFSVIDSKQ